MLTAVLALSCIALALLLATMSWKCTPFHPAAMFSVMAIADVFFPAIYWSIQGQVEPPEWAETLNPEQILQGLVWYSLFFFVFLASLLATDRVTPLKTQTVHFNLRQQHRLKMVVWALAALTIVQVVSEIMALGGWMPWLLSKTVFVAVDRAESFEANDGLFATLPLRPLLQAVVGLAFFYRRQLTRPWIYTYLFPSIALMLAVSTLLRGAVMSCAVTLLFAEMMRPRGMQLTSHRRQSAASTRRLVLAAGLAVILSMFIYGAIRDSFRELAADAEAETSALRLPTFITAGHGLFGVSHIVNKYGESLPYMAGKTYVDMLLLPVPRGIYPSKPDWYGIDDITRGMGWPESTQSAVTMAGEAFANFGWLGLAVAPAFGALFGLLLRFARNQGNRFVLLGPTLLFQVASVVNWMSFTGFMNAFPLIVLLIVLSAYICPNGRGVIAPLAPRSA